MNDRAAARALARKHISEGDPLGWFEPLYASASGDAAAIPWADLKPNPNLLSWLDARPMPAGRRGLKVGCALGDDAEELARRGFDVTAFDIAPTAVRWCERRFPRSRVSYHVADLLDPPPGWNGAFDFVLESYTLQVLPAALRERAMQSLAGFLAPPGELLLICRAREPHEPEGQMPWPLTRHELSALAQHAGLVGQGSEDFFDNESPAVRRFRCVYQRGTTAG